MKNHSTIESSLADEATPTLGPGVTSALRAFGEVVADLRHDYAASRVTLVDDTDAGGINGRDAAVAQRGERSVCFVECGGFIDTPNYDGTGASAGATSTGPAIVEDPTTTVVGLPGSWMKLDMRGFYIIAIG
jgi:N-methylhydantoinase A/oxoprolinase/acetone carboxylase beta subunit